MEQARSHKQLHEHGLREVADENGLLLLHRALSVRDVSIGTIKTIVDWNSNVLQVADHNGRYPLHLACMCSRLDVVQLMLDLDTSLLVELLDYEGNNILHLACKCGDPKVVNYLLDKYPSLAMMTNKMNLLPLHLLCQCQFYFSKTSLGTYSVKNDKQHIDSIWSMLLAHPTAVSD